MWEQQSFAKGKYDLNSVITSNVMHATADMTRVETLKNAQSLLKTVICIDIIRIRSGVSWDPMMAIGWQ